VGVCIGFCDKKLIEMGGKEKKLMVVRFECKSSQLVIFEGGGVTVAFRAFEDGLYVTKNKKFDPSISRFQTPLDSIHVGSRVGRNE
jgi:hypothetical protein